MNGTAPYTHGLSQLLAPIWVQYSSDPVISESVIEIVTLLGSNCETSIEFQEVIIPAVVSAMASDSAKKTPDILTVSACDLPIY